jgi:hypothetical protein
MALLSWAGTDDWRAESARVVLAGDTMSATGVQLGVVPVPYRLDYTLTTGARWRTRTLDVAAAGDGWERTLHLARDDDGRWSCDGGGTGDVDLPAAGGDPAAFDSAEDCDLGLSPLTNTMPILRWGLHRGGDVVEFTMAWVSVPDLGVHASLQRYEHLRAVPEGALVRYSSGDFSSDLTVDADGFVVDYPQLGRRVTT